MGSVQPDVDIDELVTQLTLEEKISLLAGRNFWETVPIPRLNIPSLRVSDGPNGARGLQFSEGTAAACFPASVSLASTWDHSLVRRVGNALAEEAISKGAKVLLGPTVCPHRSPLGGRNFESFSEDPFLAGTLAATYIKGLQENGVGATIKHFVANEQETKRFTMNVNVSEKALREIYLKPFEIAVKEAKPWALMTSYNLVNGTHSDMNEHLLQTVLRKQWGFEGLVMSDWGGTNSVIESLTAGLDLEMPGPARKRELKKVRAALENGSLGMNSVDASVLAILKLIMQTGKFDDPVEHPEQAINRPEHQKLIRETGAQGMVLLKNENNILPLKATALKSMAVLGLAKECLAHGGGSAAVTCHYKVTPYEAFEGVLGKDFDLRYAQGVKILRNLRDMSDDVFDLENKPGWTLLKYLACSFEGEPDSITTLPSGKFMSLDAPCQAVKLEGVYRPTISGSHYLSFSSLGPAKLLIDDQEVFKITKNSDDQMGFILGGAVEEQTQFKFIMGQEYKLHVEALAPVNEGSNHEDGLSLLADMLGVHLGFMLQDEYERDSLAEAIEVAKYAETVVVFVGNTPQWETEGRDMTTMTLPVDGSQDRLILAACEVNSNVIVVNSTGVAIEMPWLSRVSAVLQTWFPGQEAGNAIADVIFGKVNPSGRLPISIPRSLEDSPAYGNFPGDVKNLQVHYEEGIYIGYRYFDRNPEKVLFPFGFGLSYTEFAITDVKLLHGILSQTQAITVQARVRNIGSVSGHQIVQVYLAPLSTGGYRPQKSLAGFAKVALEPGESKTIEVAVSFEKAAFWDESSSLWTVEKGGYEILVGSSSMDIVGNGKFSVEETITFDP